MSNRDTEFIALVSEAAALDRADQGLLNAPDIHTQKGPGDGAMFALLLDCDFLA